ncbi:Putative ribonuclease H protein At1g65750 [Linum perenne]
MTATATCEHCQHPLESVSHVLRDCVSAPEVWNKIGIFDTQDSSWQIDTEDWIYKGLRSNHGLLFGIVCWHIWRARNERIFSRSNVSALSVANRAVNWTKMITDASKRTIINPGAAPNKQVKEVAWDPGPRGWVTCNSDGSVDLAGGRAAAGGLLRDSEGRCLLAFTMNLGNCSITRAEMRGAIEALQRTWDAGYRKVLLQLESQAAIDLLIQDDNMRTPHALETASFKELRHRD